MTRQRAVLQQYGETWSAGLAPPTDDSAFIPLIQRKRSTFRRLRSLAQLVFRRHAAFARDRFRLAGIGQPTDWDLIVANDVDMLPLAFAASGARTRILFDAHEYAPREFEDRLYWRILHQPHKTWLCQHYLPRIHGFTTVCDGIADEYSAVFRVRRPAVVPNAPSRHEGSPTLTHPERIRVIHHGLASRSRRIELMIDLAKQLDQRFTLDLMLVSSEGSYLDELRRRAADDPRIRFRPTVATTEIVAATRQYDIGLFLLPPTNLNYRFALPNKFFEFVQARLAVAIGPSPEMARLIEAHELGFVARDFEPSTLARQLNELDAAAIDKAKRAAHKAAEVLCWESAQSTLRQVIETLLGKSCAA